MRLTWEVGVIGIPGSECPWYPDEIPPILSPCLTAADEEILPCCCPCGELSPSPMGDRLPSMSTSPELSGLMGIPQECFGEDDILGDMLIVAGDRDGCQFALDIC